LPALKIRGTERLDGEAPTKKDAQADKQNIKTIALELKTKIEKPPETFPAFSVPFAPDLTRPEQALVDKALYLKQCYRFSGFYRVRRRVPQGLARYSDRYENVEGGRDVLDEIDAPAKLAPRELLDAGTALAKPKAEPLDLPLVDTDDLVAQAQDPEALEEEEEKKEKAKKEKKEADKNKKRKKPGKGPEVTKKKKKKRRIEEEEDGGEDDDYQKDYYKEDDDGDDDGGDEDGGTF